MIIKDLSIILKCQDYQDNDELLTVFSKEHGLITLINKGSKKLTSKRKLIPYMIVNCIYDYKEGKTIFNLNQYEKIYYFKDTSHIELLSLLNVICEITYHYLYNHDYVSPFDDLKYLIENIDLNNYLALGAIYIALLGKNSGIGAFVDHCVDCDSKLVVDVDIKKGGFVCFKHINGHIKYDKDSLRKFRLVNKAQLTHYHYLTDLAYNQKDFYLVLDFYLYHSGLNQKLFNFLKTLI